MFGTARKRARMKAGIIGAGAVGSACLTAVYERSVFTSSLEGKSSSARAADRLRVTLSA